jgi:hypothetical protein
MKRFRGFLLQVNIFVWDEERHNSTVKRRRVSWTNPGKPSVQVLSVFDTPSNPANDSIWPTQGFEAPMTSGGWVWQLEDVDPLYLKKAPLTMFLRFLDLATQQNIVQLSRAYLYHEPPYKNGRCKSEVKRTVVTRFRKERPAFSRRSICMAIWAFKALSATKPCNLSSCFMIVTRTTPRILSLSRRAALLVLKKCHQSSWKENNFEQIGNHEITWKQLFTCRLH